MSRGFLSRLTAAAAAVYLLPLLLPELPAAEPWSQNKLANALSAVKEEAGYLCFRTEGCNVVMFGGAQREACVLLVFPLEGTPDTKSAEVAGRLAEVLEMKGHGRLTTLNTGGNTLLMRREGLQELANTRDTCLGGPAIRAFAHLLTNGGYEKISLNRQGRVTLYGEKGSKSPALQFYLAEEELEALEVVNDIPKGREIKQIVMALGYGDDASRNTKERLTRNLGCRVIYYNSDDEALMAEIKGHVYVGNRDVVRSLIGNRKLARAQFAFPEQDSPMPQPIIPPEELPPTASDALDAYLRYLRNL